MDQDNPYEAPASQSATVPTGPPVRPTTATVFGVLNVIFGLLGLFGGIIGLAMLALMQSEALGQQDLPPTLNNPTLNTINLVNSVLGLGLSCVLIASGVGLLKFKAWGRSSANLYAIGSLILLVIGLIAHVIFMLLPALEIMNSMDAQNPEEVGLVAGAFGGLIGGCVGAIYPLLLLIFMNRRQFKEQILAQR